MVEEKKPCSRCRTRPRYYRNGICKECERERRQIQRIGVKKLVFSWYGNICRCCKESCLDYLTLDHVHDDGKRERGGLTFSQAVKQLGHSGTSGSFIYDRIKKGGFEQRPLDLQILCWNCQWGKRRNYGFCKHHPEIDLRIEVEYYERIMAVKGIFTPTESAKIVLAAYELKQDSNSDKFLEKLEKIFLNKLREESELIRSLNLPSSQPK